MRRLTFAALRITILPALAAAATCVVVAQFYESDRVSAWTAAALYAFAATFHGVAAQGLQGLHRFRRAMLVSLVTQLLSLPASIIALLMGAGVNEVLWISALATAASAAITATLLVRSVRALASADAPAETQDLEPPVSAIDPASTGDGRVGSMLRFAVLAGFAVLLHTVVVQRSELAFLAIFHTDEPAQIAYYAVAFAAVTAAIQVPMALVPVILPTVTTLLAAGREAAVRIGFDVGLRVLMVVSAVASGLLLAIGAPLVKLLWGEQYRAAADVVLIAGVIPVLTASSIAVITATLMAFNKVRHVVLAQSVAAVFTIGLDLALIPAWGIYGAAIANSVGQLCLALALAWTAKRTANLPMTRLTDLLRYLAIVLVVGAGGLVSWIAGLPTLVALALGAILALAGILLGVPAIKPLRDNDLDSVRGKLSSLPHAARSWIAAIIRRENTTV